ncbi:uncharacterized protein LOC136043963 [Artemia franciscana]|uniref:Uncharacterized protein n=1 Tax=Artemia franciscana TaxID=6661 RepID=A0AA88L851_ARTSF|nr:hypothetical protein QYM36_010555 [Artemia franciscana]
MSDEEEVSYDAEVSVDDVMNWYSERVSEIWNMASVSCMDLGFPEIHEQIFKVNSGEQSNSSSKLNSLTFPLEGGPGSAAVTLSTSAPVSTNTSGLTVTESVNPLEISPTTRIEEILADDEFYISSEDEFEYNDSDFEFNENELKNQNTGIVNDSPKTNINCVKFDEPTNNDNVTEKS